MYYRVFILSHGTLNKNVSVKACGAKSKEKEKFFSTDEQRVQIGRNKAALLCETGGGGGGGYFSIKQGCKYGL